MRKLQTLLLLLTASIAASSQSSDASKAVLETQRRWIESYNRRDERVLATIEADDFRVIFSDGQIQNKAAQIANLRKPIPTGNEYEIAIEESEVRVYGRAAIVNGIVIEKGKFLNEQGVAQTFRQRSRYTDTWILAQGKWRVVSSHLSELK